MTRLIVTSTSPNFTYANVVSLKPNCYTINDEMKTSKTTIPKKRITSDIYIQPHITEESIFKCTVRVSIGKYSSS